MTQVEISLPTKEQIEQRAYELYLARGCEPGMDLEDWLAAERELARETKLPETVGARGKQARPSR